MATRGKEKNRTDLRLRLGTLAIKGDLFSKICGKLEAISRAGNAKRRKLGRPYFGTAGPWRRGE